jgi:anti-sigma factor RsiW
MVCTRFQSDGMKLLDGEMSGDEKKQYEVHLQECEDCRNELEDLGMLVEWTNEMKLREPDDEFWESYWNVLYRRAERGTGFLCIMIGLLALLLYAIVKAVTSPQFLTFTGIAVTVVLVGFFAVFMSVVRERYHERKNDPYRKVKR